MGWAVRRPVIALIVWVVLLVVIGVAAVALGGKPNDSFALPNVQSTTAQDMLQKLSPSASSDPSGKVVWSPKAGVVTDAANQAAAVALLEKIADQPFVNCVTGPFGKNYGRACPAATPTDLKAALNTAVVNMVAKELKIPPAKVGDVVALIDKIAPLADASPAQLAAIARALPEIAKLASAPRSTLDALAALTPDQLNFLVGLNVQDIENATNAIGGFAKFADLPPATLESLAKANPATLAAFAAALPQDVGKLEALWTDLKAAIAKDPKIATAIEAIAKKYGISAADLQAGVTLINDIAPIASADPATLSSVAHALPELARLWRPGNRNWRASVRQQRQPRRRSRPSHLTRRWRMPRSPSMARRFHQVCWATGWVTCWTSSPMPMGRY